MAFVPPGFLQAAIEIGLDAIIVKPKRQIGPFTAQVVVSEDHTDELEITDQPVEQGASITDHAFKRPSEVTIIAGWSDSPGSSSLLGSLVSAVTGTIGGIESLLSGNSMSQVADVYKNFLAVQESRIPIDVYTGKRFYSNMLIKGLRCTTTKETENAILLTVRLRQIIIVSRAKTVSVNADPSNQDAPADTNPTADFGVKQLVPAPLYNLFSS